MKQRIALEIPDCYKKGHVVRSYFKLMKFVFSRFISLQDCKIYF